jgi:hypothetical protein
MMAVFCDDLGKRVLIDLRSITEVKGDYGRIALGYRCICGKHGRLYAGRERLSGGMSGHVA